MSAEPDNDKSEERRLAHRIRLDVLLAIACFSLQGIVLAYAIGSNGSPRAWVFWIAVFAFSASAATYAMIRASKLSKRYRYLKWGDK